MEKNMNNHENILVIGEISEGRISGLTLELLGCGRNLADKLQQKLICVFIGNKAGESAQKAIQYGAETVYTGEDESLQRYQPELYLHILIATINKLNPAVILIGQNDIGRDLAPRLAFRLDTGLSMDCIDLDIDAETGYLIQTRYIYGGNILCKLSGDRMPRIATVRPKTMQAPDPDENRKGEVISLEMKFDPGISRTKTISFNKEDSADQQGVKLEDAAVIISGGRGIGNAEGFKQLEELAAILKGAVGATRPPCDGGWVSTTKQIGLTGKIVAPDLYIAIALSGSSQHMAGCSGSKTVVAINRDPEANIFKVSNFGAVGDWKQILPAFKEKIAELCR